MNQEAMPVGNDLLDALNIESRSRLLEAGRWVDIAPDDCLDFAADLGEWAFFPSSCILQLIGDLHDGSSAGLLLASSEGFVGSSIFPADFGLASKALTVLPGRALRIPGPVLIEEFNRDQQTRWVLLKSLHQAFEQASETSACRARLQMEQLLSRWLVMVVERAGLSTVRITQERLAQILGMRRESVSLSFSRLRAGGLVDCRRCKASTRRQSPQPPNQKTNKPGGATRTIG